MSTLDAQAITCKVERSRVPGFPYGHSAARFVRLVSDPDKGLASAFQASRTKKYGHGTAPGTGSPEGHAAEHRAPIGCSPPPAGRRRLSLEMHYVAILKREGANTLVSFPDCPGCQTFGRTRERALSNAREALEGWLEAHLVAGDAPPAPERRASRSARRNVPVTISPILAVRLQLRWARQSLGLTQAALAKRVGVTRQQIALLEAPDSNVTLRTLERVASAMNLRLEVELRHDTAAA